MLKNHKIIAKQFASATKSDLTRFHRPKVAILGVPFHKGQSKRGVENGPEVLRKNNLLNDLKSATKSTVDIKDYGNLSYTPCSDNLQTYPEIKDFADFMGCNKALMKKIEELLHTNDQFITLGGDHAIGFGSVAGHLKYNSNLSVVWVDAHADINSALTSKSMNVHGMPVSLLLKEMRDVWAKLPLNHLAPNCITADQLVYVGLRDVDPEESNVLKKLGIRCFEMDKIRMYGIEKVIEMTLDSLNPKNKIHVSFDIDALDVSVTPSTGTAVEGGLTLDEGLSLMGSLKETNRVQGIDLVEFNPLLGSKEDVEKTTSAIKDILKTICGFKHDK